MKTALILYWSHTGNTEKVAASIQAGLQTGGMSVAVERVPDAGDLDFFDYDLVCVGFPSYNWRPPKPMDDYLRDKFAHYRQAGRILPGAPTVPGKNALIFCTYSGPHTGIKEAIPAGKYAGQFFEHLGFTVLDEWYVLSEFHGNEDMSTKGRMGNIKGLPNEADLIRMEDQARLLVSRLQS
ncbi:MAG: flavodoxin domain-containing protein [Thermoleophilia bacterium]|nr:flavodoxin domain-containing protein [Thermoleophilia bacterium]